MNDVEVTYRLWPYWTNSTELVGVTHAFMIAADVHRDQRRKYNGNPYITHPVRVALAVSSYPLVRLPMVQAAFLHDTREDLPEHYTLNQLEGRIRRECGEEALALVVELTNVKVYKEGRRVPRREQKQLDWERLSKVSKEAKILKMFDRIDNLREMTNALASFKKLYAEESLELLKAVGDGDTDVAFQLETTVKHIFDWQHFPLEELCSKPDGTVFEYFRTGGEIGTDKCWIERKGMRYHDGSWKSFDCDPEEWHIILRETGDSV
jgi:hypothetical protein